MITMFLAAALAATAPAITLDWSVPLGENSAGGPVAFGSPQSAQGVLVTLGSGRVLLIGPDGKIRTSMKLDMPVACPAASGKMTAAGENILAADLWGSLYCFDITGRRLWKYARASRTGGGFNYIVLADLHGDGHPEAILTDARGNLYAVDARGRLRLEVHVTDFRVSAPAVGDVNGDGHPELVFGSEDSEIYCLDSRGEVLWTRRLEGGRFGRSLPVIADGKVYVTTSFNSPGTGLYALDGATGRVLWKAPSRQQSYNSIVVADLAGHGARQILFGDKNTRLYAVDTAGRPLWDTQLGGRGIFFAAAAADLMGDGAGLAFQVVRGSGAEGKSLYAVNAGGKIVDAWAIQGGGGSPPLLVRFTGEKELKLLFSDAAGKLNCYRLPQTPGKARILWPPEQPSWGPAASPAGPAPASRTVAARGGANAIDFGAPVAGAYPRARIVEPDGTVRVKIVPQGLAPVASFEAAQAGAYQVSVRWIDAATNKTLREIHTQYRLAAAVKAAPDVGADVEVRQIENPWPNFDAERFLRASRAPINAVSVKMLGNEYESVALAVTNRKARPATLRIECQGCEQYVEFREVPLVRVETTGRASEDVLPLLGEGQTIWLGPGETRKVWLTLRSKDLAAGTHRATIRLGDMLSVQPPLEVPLTVEVRRVRLPEQHVYRHGNWLYLAAIKDEAVREATIKDALEHGTNVFNVPGVSVEVASDGRILKANTEPHDTLIKRLRGRAFFMIGGSVGVVWPRDFKPAPALDDKTYAEAIRWYVAHMRELGVGYQEWAFYTMDEPGLMGRDSSFANYVAGLKRIKTADPRAQIYANPAGGARAEVLREIENLVDVWQPDLHLVREQPEALGAIFKKGQYWHYEAPGDQRNLDPLGYYRMKPWVAFQMGMTGGGYWVYSSSDYWFYDRYANAGYGTVYPGTRGPVTTRRWEASRDGIEDFELLWMLREAAAKDGTSAGRQALRLVDEAVAFVTKGQDQVSDISRQVRPYAPDFDKWMDYRERLIQAAERLIHE